MSEIAKVNNDTWRIEDDFVRFFLLEGKDKAVLIDSGANCPNASDLAKTITNKPIMLLNTHGDEDHASGTNGFSKIHIHPLDYTCCGMKEKYPNTEMVELKDGDVVELGKRPLKIIHIPGHTMGSIAILDVNRKALYAGDSVQKGNIFMFGKHRDPKSFMDSLDKLIALKSEYDFIYASHDEFMIPNDYVEKVKAVWQQVINGELEYELLDLFGNKVKSYSTPVCGFYTE